MISELSKESLGKAIFLAVEALKFDRNSQNQGLPAAGRRSEESLLKRAPSDAPLHLAPCHSSLNI
jgi:hypothetical protein